MSKTWPAFLTVLFALSLGIPVSAYDVPLTESAIRDAYFLGTRLGGIHADFLAGYARLVADLKQGNCTSQARLETPFLQVAEYSGKAPNYSAPSALKDFSEKPSHLSGGLLETARPGECRNRQNHAEQKRSSSQFVREFPVQ